MVTGLYRSAVEDIAEVATTDCCKQIAGEFGIPERDVMDAFEGEPVDRAYKVCAWVIRQAKSPLQRGMVLTAWAKKNRAGIYSKPRGPRDEQPARPRSKDRVRFTADQILSNLDRMEG